MVTTVVHFAGQPQSAFPSLYVLVPHASIDMMMKEPNLIRRPIVVKGSKVIFGFDKEQYAKL